MLDLGTLRLGIKVDSDSAKSELNKVGSAVEGTGVKTASLASKAITMIKAFAAAYAVKELIKLGKAALEAYAKFEQLEGGVKKIFGNKASKDVIKNAERAYKTAGLSVNEYMEQVTSFSSSLIKSLGGDTKKAAKIADMAVQDMSDNANTFGTDVKSIQQAYQGFAKGNFTMLDNLKLGYGGTRSEMVKLLEEAEKISGIHYDIDNLSDIYEAIHVIQGEIGITGTTAKEAAKTIEGSTTMMKAAWQNMLLAIGRGKGVEKATQKFLDSLGTVAKNVAPVALTIIKALAKALVKAAVYLVEAGAEAMKKFIEGFLDNHPKIASAVEIIGKVFKVALTPAIKLIETVTKVWKALMGQRATKKFTVEAPFSKAVSSIKEVFGKWASVLGQKAKKTYGIVKSGFDTAQSGMDAILNKWKDILKQTAKKTYTVAKKGFDTVLSGLKSIYNKWKDILNQKSTKTFTTKYKTEGSTKNKQKGGPQQRIGLREVPYDGYQTTLHKGEAVLTAAETNMYKALLNSSSEAKTAGGDTISINVYGSEGMSATEIAAAVERRLIQSQNRRRLAWQ